MKKATTRENAKRGEVKIIRTLKFQMLFLQSDLDVQGKLTQKGGRGWLDVSPLREKVLS